MLNSQSLTSILSDLGYKNIEEAALQQAEFILLSKISKYKAENNFFNQKYKCAFNLFKSKIQKNTNRENFDEENDLLDWQFAIESLEKYEKQHQELQK